MKRTRRARSLPVGSSDSTRLPTMSSSQLRWGRAKAGREELLRWFRMERSVGDQDGEPIEGEVEGAFHHWYREALEDIAPGSANAKYKH